MATIPSEEKVFMVSNGTNTTFSGSAATKAMQEWYTMQDVIDTVSTGLPPSGGVFEAGIGEGAIQPTAGNNYATGIYATIGGGICNTASANRSAVVGGYCNTAYGDTSFIGGGCSNTASGYSSSIAGGTSNNASAYYSTVGGGLCNTASNSYSTVGGGFCNTASGDTSIKIPKS